MRRIRNEQIHEIVNGHMKRRKYTESETIRKSQRLAQSAEQLSLKSVVKCDDSTQNVVSFSSISGDATQCDQQFTKLKTFLNNSVEPLKTELQPVLYPVFVHVYLELISNGQRTPGHKFFSRHQGLFSRKANCQPFLATLSKLTTKEEVETNPDVQHFRRKKSQVRVSRAAMSSLQCHLVSGNHVLMIQIFSKHIHLQVTDDETCKLDFEENPDAQSTMLASPPYTPDNKVIQSEASLSTLQHCIKQVRNCPPSLPSVCFYTVTSNGQGMCCGCISEDKRLLATGFEDSSVRLWTLTSSPLVAAPSDVNISHIHLAGDYEEDILEKERPPGPSDVLTLRGHSGSVYGCQFTPDNRYLLSCSEDTTVRLWDMNTFTNKVVYHGHDYPVWGIAVSKLGQTFATCSHDRTAKLWNTEYTYPLRSLVGHTMDVDCVQFHPNSKYIATGSADRTVRLWSVDDAQSVRLMQGHRSGVFCLAFAPDGQYLASAGDDKKIKIWDLRMGQLLKEFKGHTDTIHTMSFNTDSTLLASGGLDCHIRIWNVSNPGRSECHPEATVSPELMSSYTTKTSVVSHLNFSRTTLLYGIGSCVD